MANKKKADNKPKQSENAPQERTEAAAATATSQIIDSNEYHAPIDERAQSVNASGRMFKFVLLILGLLILAAIVVALLHESPV